MTILFLPSSLPSPLFCLSFKFLLCKRKEQQQQQQQQQYLLILFVPYWYQATPPPSLLCHRLSTMHTLGNRMFKHYSMTFIFACYLLHIFQLFYKHYVSYSNLTVRIRKHFDLTLIQAFKLNQSVHDFLIRTVILTNVFNLKGISSLNGTLRDDHSFNRSSDREVKSFLYTDKVVMLDWYKIC